MGEDPELINMEEVWAAFWNYIKICGKVTYVEALHSLFLGQ